MRHLEAMRGTPMAPNADASQLGPEACPIYRPDVKGIAYWELEIAGVKSVSRKGPNGDGKLRRSTSGFIIVVRRQARRAGPALELRARAAEPRPRGADEGRPGREGREARLARVRGGGRQGQVPDASRPVPADAERAAGRAAEGASDRLARVASHDGDEDRQARREAGCEAHGREGAEAEGGAVADVGPGEEAVRVGVQAPSRCAEGARGAGVGDRGSRREVRRGHPRGRSRDRAAARRRARPSSRATARSP